MTRAAKYSNLAAVVLPFIAFLGAVVLLWNDAVDWIDLTLLGVFYVLTALGVTVGFHRLLTHRAFQTHRPLQYLFATLGSMSVEGPVIHWVADHRKHHAHTDVEGDPHSPHVGGGTGLRGFIHAHMGWLMTDQGGASARRYAADLVEDRGMRRISDAFPWIVLVSLALPAVLGFFLHGMTLAGLATGLLWGGFVRIFFVHHVTWSINSVCHFMGSRRFDIDDRSTNVFWLAIPSFGEAWHHNHHAFPRSAAHGLRRREIDLSAMLIRAMRRTGLAWDVIEISPERQAQRELAPRGGAPVAG